MSSAPRSARGDRPRPRAPGGIDCGKEAVPRRLGWNAALVAITLLLLLPVGTAHGDGDPASDVLLIQNAFYPYQPPAPPKLEAALNALLGELRSAGMSLKVAIVGSREDLGAVPTYFGHPQQYATFLDREISYNARAPQPLLVVMPAGFGLVAATPASALTRVSIDGGARTSGLTRAAILAVSALARANGHAIAAPAIAGTSPSRRGGSPSALLFGLPALLLVLVGLPVLLRRRRESPSRS